MRNLLLQSSADNRAVLNAKGFLGVTFPTLKTLAVEKDMGPEPDTGVEARVVSNATNSTNRRRSGWNAV